MKKYIISYALLIATSAASMEMPDAPAIKVVNKESSNIYCAIGVLQVNKSAIEEIGSIVVIPSGKEHTFPAYNYGNKTVVLVSKKNGTIDAFDEKKPSLMSLRTNRDIEFQTIPANCTGGTLIYTVSKGRIGKLRISLDKSKSTCTSAARKAWQATKAKMSRPASRAPKSAQPTVYPAEAVFARESIADII